MDLSRASSPTTQGGTPVAEIHPSDFKQQQVIAKAFAGQAPPATVEGVPTTSRAQAGALFKKNAVYQRRNCCSNCCLLSAPIVFCLLLLGIQLAVNRLIFSGEDYACGCKCTKCCYQGNRDNCTSVSAGTCQYDCLDHDSSTCGIQYSTPRQSVFCAITHTTAWPPILQVPREELRAVPFKPDPVLLYTGQDSSLAGVLTAGTVPAPRLTMPVLTGLLRYLRGFGATFGDVNAITIPAELLSLVGLYLGSSSMTNAAGVYIEPAMQGRSSSLDALFPNGTCDEMLASRSHYNVTLPTMLSAMINVSVTPAQAAAMNDYLKAEGALLGQVSALKFNCTDVVTRYSKTVQQLQGKLYCGYRQARCDGSSASNQYATAYDWQATSTSYFQPNIYYNDTMGLTGNQGGRTLYQRLPQALNMAVNSWIRRAIGSNYTADLIGVQETPKPEFNVRVEFSSILGPLFFTWAIQMLMPIYMMQLVYEKEKKLRMMMKMHGLGDRAYWLVTYVWFLCLYIAYMLIFVIFGTLIGLNIFRKNSYGVQFVLYFLWGNNMIAFSFLMSCFFSSSKTATVFAYLLVFATGLLGSLLLDQLIRSNQWYMILIQIIPSFSLYRGLLEMGQYAFLGNYRSSYGMTGADLKDPANGMVGAWIILLVEWFVFMALAWYLEQVFASGTGNKRHPLYFLDSCRKNAGKKQPLRVSADQHAAVDADPEAEDVAAEHARVLNVNDYITNPIVIRDLKKVYPGLDGQPPKMAVRSLNLAIERGECFGLLGPNGAGKSTSISMMIGLLEPSAGTAIIGGHDITKDMEAIYTMMGVCPQHDLLWDNLTGREHLLFYGRLKGMSGKALQQAVEDGLRSVNLWNGGVADKQAGQYSGGMKRRLSVAISFMGDPLVVYLDEPSTGLDPASRRNLWEVVKKGKRSSAIVLTTHSMEEAEVLCDRLGIFVDGKLVCVGNPKEITSRYGGYLVFTLAVPEGQAGRARELVWAQLSSGARLTYSVGGTMKFELPTEEVSLSKVFDVMAGLKEEVQVLDWSVANATLEEVFIKFARQIGARTASMDGHDATKRGS